MYVARAFVVLSVLFVAHMAFAKDISKKEALESLFGSIAGLASGSAEYVKAKEEVVTILKTTQISVLLNPEDSVELTGIIRAHISHCSDPEIRVELRKTVVRWAKDYIKARIAVWNRYKAQQSAMSYYVHNRYLLSRIVVQRKKK